MRWPFGPPHMTLKPSKKTNKNKQKKNNKKNKQKKQQHPTTTPRTKQTKQKQKQDKKEKQTQETQKHLNLPNPDEQQWATPEKNPKLGKTSIFNTFETIPDTPKTNLLILKPQKNKPPKNTILPCSKTTHHFFINFLFFSTYSFCFWKTVFCWKHYKNSVFRKTQLFKTTVSKTHFFNHVKKHLFQRKGVIFGFGQFPLKPLFL